MVLQFSDSFGCILSCLLFDLWCQQFSVIRGVVTCFYSSYMSLVLRKPDFAYAKTKVRISFTELQLCSCTADQCLYFRYRDSTIFSSSQIQNFKFLAYFCTCNCKGHFIFRPGRKLKLLIFSHKGSYTL